MGHKSLSEVKEDKEELEKSKNTKNIHKNNEYTKLTLEKM